MTISSTPDRRFCRFLTILGPEAAVPVAGHGYLDRADIGQRGLGPGAVPCVAAVLPGRVVLVIAEMVGDLAPESGLQEPLGQLLEQAALAGQLKTLGLSPAPSARQSAGRPQTLPAPPQTARRTRPRSRCCWSSEHLP